MKFRDSEMQKRHLKDKEMIARIQSGGKLTIREMIYCLFHWSPFKQFHNTIRFIRARKS